MNGKKVLIIDDDRTLTTLLQSTLSEYGYQIATAPDGQEGLLQYRSFKPDLIILDILMPTMDGYTFVQEFKTIGGNLRDTPMIVLTSREKMKDIFAIEGINDYIVKPFDMKDLLRKIEKHLIAPLKKVLIVDDSAEMVDLVEMGLSDRGYDVITAANGIEGLDLAKKETPDLVVLDVMMPKLSGYNVCRMLKFDEKYKDISIVLLSALGQDKDRQLGQEVGADAFLCKPFSGDTLLDTMKELLWD